MSDSQPRILGIAGSLRQGSYSGAVLRGLQESAVERARIDAFSLAPIPMYNADLDGDHKPEAVIALKNAIRTCDGLVLVSPEYNYGMPGVLKNALDWASRPWGTNSWKDKPAAVCGISVGAAGTALAQQHLRNVLAYLDVPTLGQPEIFLKHTDSFFDGSGAIANEDTRKFLTTFVQRFEAWVQRHHAEK